MSQNLSSAAVMIGDLRANWLLHFSSFSGIWLTITGESSVAGIVCLLADDSHNIIYTTYQFKPYWIYKIATKT